MTTTQSYLLSKNGLQYVSPEDSRSAEELFFAFRKAKVRFQFAIQERNRTRSMSNLYPFQKCESDGKAVAQGEELSPRLGDPGLSTFVAWHYTKFVFRESIGKIWPLLL